MRSLLTARIAPIGRPFPTGLHGGGLQRCQLDTTSVLLTKNASVRVNHGDQDVGKVGVVIRHKDWFVGDLWLADFVDDETEAAIKPGQPVSVGLRIIRSQIDPATGVEHIHQAELEELSLCRRGMVPGAQIIYRTTPRRSSPPPVGRASDVGAGGGGTTSNARRRDQVIVRARDDGSVEWGGPIPPTEAQIKAARLEHRLRQQGVRVREGALAPLPELVERDTKPAADYGYGRVVRRYFEPPAIRIY